MMGYTTVDMLLDDVSKQMASSDMQRRYSRGSNGQGQRGNGSMRVVKPNSASTSPRGSMGLGRRRTVMSDGTYRRRVAMMDQYMAAAAGGFVPPNDGYQVPPRSNRPMSWHPAGAEAIQQRISPAPGFDTMNEFIPYDLPPTPAVYSGYTSPSSTFSPLSMPFTGYEQQQFAYPSSNFYPSNPSNTPYHPSAVDQQSENYLVSSTGDMDTSMYSHLDWSNFAANGFECSTAPPTPDNFLPIQHPDPAFPPEESIPYHSLSDSESEGEELIGMGLYDSPEITKIPSSDPQLDNYRASMMSQLLGSGYRKAEPTGKGLKLEDAWNPPTSDDEEDGEEEDGEAEDEEESTDRSSNQQTQAVKDAVVQKNDGLPLKYNQSFGRNGWL